MLRITLGLVIGGALDAASGYFMDCTGGSCPLAGSPWRGAISGAVIGLLIALQK